MTYALYGLAAVALTLCLTAVRLEWIKGRNQLITARRLDEAIAQRDRYSPHEAERMNAERWD